MRSPWSMPTRYELAQVGVGMALGAALCMLFVSIGEPKFGWAVAFIVPALLYVAWMISNIVGWARDSAAREKERKVTLAKLERESAESRYWSYEANHAATRKRTGLAWTGYRKRR